MSAYSNDPEEAEIVRREAARLGISETTYRMWKASFVGGRDVMRDICADHVGKPSPLTPSSMSTTPSDRAPKRGDGWVDAKPLTPPPGIEHVDAIAEAFAERERRQAILQLAEEAEAASRLEHRRRMRELDPCNTGIYKTEDELDRGE
jgi:hypothetical protein